MQLTESERLALVKALDDHETSSAIKKVCAYLKQFYTVQCASAVKSNKDSEAKEYAAYAYFMDKTFLNQLDSFRKRREDEN